MKRTTWNMLIDALAFVAFVLLASTGFLLTYQLPPGSGGRDLLAAGQHAAGKDVNLLWGMTRHEWGEVHYWLAIAILAIMAVHLLLHWKWIVCTLQRKTDRRYSGRRVVVGIFSLVAVVALAAAPYLTTTSQMTAEEFRSSRIETTEDVSTESVPATNGEDTHSLRGNMTLQKISEASDVPIEVLIRELNLPEYTEPNEQAGRLLRRHGLTMQELREVVKQYEQLPEEDH